MATGKSIIKNFKKDKGFEIIPRELLQHCDKKAKDKNGKENGKNGLSLQAIGLLVNLQSYPEDWELHKTELYTRYSKNGKTSVMSAWDELVEKKYIIQFHKRVGKANQYIYYYNLTPFTDEDIKEVERLESLKSKESLSFSKSEAQNGKLKMGSSKSATNKEQRKESTQKHITQEYNNLNNMYNLKENNDRERQTSHSSKSSNHSQNSFNNLSEDQYKKEMSFNKYPEMMYLQLNRLNYEDAKLLMDIINKAKKAVSKEYADMKNDFDFTYESHESEISKVMNLMILKAKFDNISINHLSAYISRSIQNYFRNYAEELLQQIIEDDMSSSNFKM